MEKQRTIKAQVSLKGIGIHTGREANITFKPAPANSGINFIRVDLDNKPVIPAKLSFVLDESLRARRTSIGKNGTEVHTIEHLMASFYALGIDNIFVEIDSIEVPVFDGSAKEIVKALKQTGFTEQDASRNQLTIREPLWVNKDGSTIIILPSDKLTISYTLAYDHAGLKSQHNHFVVTPELFENKLAPSRTFCLKNEVEQLLKSGLAKGGSLNNTVIIDEKGAPSVELRFEDEFLRHKVLDLIGDIFLSGFFLKAHIIGIKSGHSLNMKIVQKIIAEYGSRKSEDGSQRAEVRGHKSDKTPFLDKEQIKKIIPHREPFLLIDEIVEMEETIAVGIKYVDENEYYFKGHFPGRPIMPGVLILEALAQVGGVLMLNKPRNKGKLAYFISINNAKFRKPVVPGDKLRLEIVVTRDKTRIGQVHGKALVNGSVAAEADLMFSMVD